MALASRTFVVEVPDDAEIHVLDTRMLEEVADGAGVPWVLDGDYYCHATDHQVIHGDLNEDEDQSALPVVRLGPAGQ